MPLEDDFEHYLTLDRKTENEKFRQLQDLVLGFYQNHGKNYPWRNNASPYSTLVSEFMLQQTQGDRVAVKFIQFLETFPDIKTLAEANLADVLALWQGLGYNRRARFLHETSKLIQNEHSGTVPNNTEILQSFPGIGYPTACAIRAYAYNEPVIYIETNIRTVFIHHFFHDKDKVSDSDLLPLVEKALVKDEPALWYNALMDYGVMLKKQLPNPGRKSRHHVRQTKFKGSRRELRGRIIAYLVKNKSASTKDIADSTGRTIDEVESVFEDMCKEGMVAEERNIYRIT